MTTKPLKGMRALVIEDEFFEATDLHDLLLSNGAEMVQLSGSPEDAMRQIGKDFAEVALVDLNLRGSLSFDLADELARRGVPFGFVTGYSNEYFPDRFRDAPHWQKPIDQRTFLPELERLWRGTGDAGPRRESVSGS